MQTLWRYPTYQGRFAMSQVAVESGATVALFGFGVTGRAVASELIERNTSVLVFDDSPNDEMVSAAEAIGVNLVAPKVKRNSTEILRMWILRFLHRPSREPLFL